MKKQGYQLIMHVLPAYLIVLPITVVLAFILIPKAHAQTNVVTMIENSSIRSANFDIATKTATNTTLYADKIVDDEIDEMTLSLNPSHDHVYIGLSKKITNIVVYDLANNEVEDVVIDIPSQQIDFSSSCPGIYYIRVDYYGGSSLRRMVVQ
jgi:hypothetical protein